MAAAATARARGPAHRRPRPSARRPLADYYVYPLPERTTIADNQTKQVGFLDAQGVAARKVYE